MIGKRVALTIGMVLALAVMAPAAFGEEEEAKPEFKLESAPAWVEGGQTEQFVLATTGGLAKCPTVEFASPEIKKTSDSTLELGANFNVCTVFGQLGATPATNGCKFLFHLVPGGAGKATTDITCPTGKEMNFPGQNCTVTIPAQNSLGTARFTNTVSESPPDIDVEFALLEIKYKETLGCGAAAETKNGTLIGKATLYGVDEFSEPLKLWFE